MCTKSPKKEKGRTTGRKPVDKSSRKTWGSWSLTKVFLAELFTREPERRVIPELARKALCQQGQKPRHIRLLPLLARWMPDN